MNDASFHSAGVPPLHSALLRGTQHTAHSTGTGDGDGDGRLEMGGWRWEAGYGAEVPGSREQPCCRVKADAR